MASAVRAGSDFLVVGRPILRAPDPGRAAAEIRAQIEQAYDALIKNLPQDARQFFKEGLQQMDIVGYPDEVREVVERYNNMWGTESSLH